MQEMVVTTTLVVRNGVTRQQVMDYLRATLVIEWDTNPIVFVRQLAVTEAPADAPAATP